GTAKLTAVLLFNTTGGPTAVNLGTVNVQQGTLALNIGSSSTFTNRGTVRVSAGATLSAPAGLRSDGGTVRGGGQITANLSFTGTGNELRPGSDAAPGTLTVRGNVALNAGTTLFARLNGATAGSGYDQLAVNGTVDLGGAALAAALGGGYTPAAGDKLFVLTNDGTDAITGTFAGL